jgi:iron(III) transport system substrate-binding protein
VVWSSGHGPAVKLVNDGHAMRYPSTEIDRLPAWSVWRTEAYGTTFEPLGLAYDERLIPQDQLPRTHADLARFLVSGGSRFADKVLAYDLANAGLGFLVATQDARASPAFWDIARAMGRAAYGCAEHFGDARRHRLGPEPARLQRPRLLFAP